MRGDRKIARHVWSVGSMSPECQLQYQALLFQRHGHHRDLHSFPTRRSSDLNVYIGAGAKVLGDVIVGEGSVVGANAVVIQDRKSTRLNSSHANISYAVFCLKKKSTAIEV